MGRLFIVGYFKQITLLFSGFPASGETGRRQLSLDVCVYNNISTMFPDEGATVEDFRAPKVLTE